MTRTSKVVKVNHAINYRNYRRARDRALTRLANAYPETYKELLEQEKVNDETTAGNWVAIGDDASITVGIFSRTDDSGIQGHEYHKEDEGDYGGEA